MEKNNINSNNPLWNRVGQFLAVAELSGSKGTRNSSFGRGRKEAAESPGARLRDPRASRLCQETAGSP